MGMFDSVYARCPKCGNRLEFQSKAGLCELKRYSSDSVPQEVAIGVSGDSEECECGAVVTIEHPNPDARVMMTVRTDDTDEWD